MVCVSFVLGMNCACILVGGSEVWVFSPSNGEGCVRWYILECFGESSVLMMGFVNFVLLIVWARHPSLGVVGSWVMPGLVCR